MGPGETLRVNFAFRTFLPPMSFAVHITGEVVIKSIFASLTCIYALVTYRDTQDRSPSNPSITEWEVCWPLATWYISWHTAICLSVVSLPSCLFRLDAVDVADYKTHGPDWRRLTILFLWYLVGIPIAYTMQNTCSVGAPGTWARAGRVFIEGVVAFGLGGVIYGLGRCLFPTYHSRRVLLPYTPEKVPLAPQGDIKSGGIAESV